MYAAQLLMQLAGVSGTMWELPTVSSGKNTAQDSGTSFQTLLQQRQKEDTTQNLTDTNSTQEESPEQPLPDQTKTEDSEAPAADLAAMGAALMMDGVLPIRQDMTTIQQPQVQTVAPVISQTPVVSADVGETVMETVPVQTQPQVVQPQTEQEAGTTQQAAPAAEVPTQVQTVPEETVRESVSAVAQDRQDGQTVRQEDGPQVTETAGSMEAPLFAQTEQVPVKVGEAVPVDTTAPAPELEQTLGKALESGLEKGEQRVEIQLSPANLGTVTAEFIRSPEGVLHVVLRAQNPEAAKLLGDHAGALGLLLQDGTNNEVRVEVPQPQQNQQLWQQPDQEGGRHQQQQQQQRPPQQEAESFLHQLRLGLVETAPEEIM